MRANAVAVLITPFRWLGYARRAVRELLDRVGITVREAGYMRKIKVGVVYPVDPVGSVIGGIDSFIRGLIKYAPNDIEYVVYGATTDAETRPVRRWSDCVLGTRACKFFPVMKMSGSGRQPRIPATLTYELSSILLRLPELGDCDILESHRIEHFLLRGARKPVNLFLHQNMAVLKQGGSDIRWRIVPELYRLLEKKVLYKASSVHCVREDAVNSYKGAFPSIGDKFRFQSTWMDPDIFYPVESSERAELRARLSRELLIPDNRKWLVAVGRLDYQKDPLLMMKALQTAVRRQPEIHLIWVGDGVLRDDVLKVAHETGLSGSITLTGLLNPDQVADVNRAADMFVMSSAYEGMPIALIEAMACGLPVVTTCVGEVRRLVNPGYNGEVCAAGDAIALAAAIERGVRALGRYSGDPCIESANRYTPQKVLEPVYANYRRLAADMEENSA